MSFFLEATVNSTPGLSLVLSLNRAGHSPIVIPYEREVGHGIEIRV
jgi:hypothetical protein